MAKPYDYLVVGTGLFGAVFARQVTNANKKCLVIEKRSHIAGNCYTQEIEGIHVHRYGPHIFHTNKEAIWRYVNQFAQFNHYINSPIANYKGEIYNLPFNMNTFSKMWGIEKPSEAKAIIEQQRLNCKYPSNLEEQALSLVGHDIYEKLIKGYTEKQWGRSCKDLPPEIIRRLPVRFTYNNNYFNARWQGIPINGYTAMIENILLGINTNLNVNYLDNRDYYDSLAETIVFTGSIDSFFDYSLGALEYRSLSFDTQILEKENYQGCAVVNYTDSETPYTRIIEHKHFAFGEQDKSVVTREYPAEWSTENEPFYPICDDKNNLLYNNYYKKAKPLRNIIFGGRLGSYKYYDMDQVIEKALEAAKKTLA